MVEVVVEEEVVVNGGAVVVVVEDVVLDGGGLVVVLLEEVVVVGSVVVGVVAESVSSLEKPLSVPSAAYAVTAKAWSVVASRPVMTNVSEPSAAGVGSP